MSHSDSKDSLISGESSTLAGSHNNYDDPRQYYSNGYDGRTYPPAMGYSSDTPYDPSSHALKRDRSLTDSAFSVVTGSSFDSLARLKNHDAMKDEFDAVIKGGRKHLSDMVSAADVFRTLEIARTVVPAFIPFDCFSVLTV